MATFQFKGLDELIKKLNKLPDATVKAILRKGFQEALVPMRDAAIREAPKDTGDLAQAIKISPTRSKRNYVYANVRVGDKDFTGKQFYAGFIQFGSHRNGILYPPNPFLTRAFDSTHDQVRNRAVKVIAEGIAEALKD